MLRIDAVILKPYTSSMLQQSLCQSLLSNPVTPRCRLRQGPTCSRASTSSGVQWPQARGNRLPSKRPMLLQASTLDAPPPVETVEAERPAGLVQVIQHASGAT